MDSVSIAQRLFEAHRFRLQMMALPGRLKAVVDEPSEINFDLVTASFLISGAACAQDLLDGVGKPIGIAQHKAVELLLAGFGQFPALQGLEMQADRGQRSFEYVGNGVDETVVLLAAAELAHKEDRIDDHSGDDQGEEDNPKKEQYDFAAVEDDPPHVEGHGERNQADAQAEKEDDGSAAARNPHSCKVILSLFASYLRRAETTKDTKGKLMILKRLHLFEVYRIIYTIFRYTSISFLSTTVGMLHLGIRLTSRIHRWATVSLFLLICSLSSSGQDGYFAQWFPRVDKTQAKQPHWITPLYTVTPRLEEEFRSDITWTPTADGNNLNYGGGKGLELIPTEHTEVILGVPPYQVPASGPAGGGNIPLLLKYRLFTGNESHGNYIVTAFLGGSIPAGRFATAHGSITPTVAFGKGYRDFDFQSTLGWTIPTGGRQKSGTPVAYNVAFQYRLLRKIWPEVEANITLWPNGSLVGQKQVFISPGLLAGRFHLWKRLALSIGGGEQIAVTHYHQYNHAPTLSVRFPF